MRQAEMRPIGPSDGLKNIDANRSKLRAAS